MPVMLEDGVTYYFIFDLRVGIIYLVYIYVHFVCREAGPSKGRIMPNSSQKLVNKFYQGNF